MTDTTNDRVVTELDVALIEPDPQNLRRTDDVDRGLTDSIAAHGVLQPLTVWQDLAIATRYNLVFGHRRLFAAKQAGLTTVPCIIDPALADPKLRLEVQLVENLQRQDLDPVEEATGYYRLVNELGGKIKDISTRVGKSAAHVSRRLSLLELPEKPLSMVRQGKATPEQALELLKLGSKEAILAVMNQEGPYQWERIVEHTIGQRERHAKVTETADKLRAKGLVVLGDLPDHQTSARLDNGDLRFVNSDGEVIDKPEANIKLHAKEPCHAVHVYANYSNTIGTYTYCLNPKRHRKSGESDLKAPSTADANPERTAERRIRKLIDAINTARTNDLIALVKKPSAEVKGLLEEIRAYVTIEQLVYYTDRRNSARPISEALGLAPLEYTTKVVDPGGVEAPKITNHKDWWAPLQDFIDKSRPNLIKAGNAALIIEMSRGGARIKPWMWEMLTFQLPPREATADEQELTQLYATWPQFAPRQAESTESEYPGDEPEADDSEGGFGIGPEPGEEEDINVDG